MASTAGDFVIIGTKCAQTLDYVNVRSGKLNIFCTFRTRLFYNKENNHMYLKSHDKHF